MEHQARLHVRLATIIPPALVYTNVSCLTLRHIYATAEYFGVQGLARKQVLWDYIIATKEHSRVLFNGRTDESGKAKPPPFDGNSHR